MIVMRKRCGRIPRNSGNSRVHSNVQFDIIMIVSTFIHYNGLLLILMGLHIKIDKTQKSRLKNNDDITISAEKANSPFAWLTGNICDYSSQDHGFQRLPSVRAATY
jgi:hypothetical protein